MKKKLYLKYGGYKTIEVRDSFSVICIEVYII